MSADHLAESMASRLRSMLGAVGDSIPDARAAVSWLGMDDRLEVTIRRNAPLRYALLSTRNDSIGPVGIVLPAEARDARGGRLLSAALDSVRASGEPFFLWPDSSSVDSLTFSVGYIRDAVTRTGTVERYSERGERSLFTVLSLPAPRETQAITAIGNSKPRYPTEARQQRVAATVLTRFVIDTNGRAVPGTLRFVSLKNKTSRAEAVSYYPSFVEEVRKTVLAMRFRSATAGGCKINWLALLPFEFTLGS